MNKVILIGNLTKNPEIKHTNTGKKVANFTLAISEGKDKPATFINCIAWEKTADVLERYAFQGNKLAVEGKIQNRSWEKPDGTKGYATDIVVFTIELLTSKNAAKTQTGEPTTVVQELPDVSTIDLTDIGVTMPF